MSRLSIVTAVCGSMETTRQWIAETVGSCGGSELPEVIIVSNGDSDEDLAALTIEVRHLAALGHGGETLVFPDPMGSAAAFNAGWQVARGEVVAMLHNDLLVRESNWGARLLDWFDGHPRAGVIGFHGSKGLGAPDIYRVPYRLQQLARQGPHVSNLEDAEAHGHRSTEPVPVLTLDAMALIARRADLEEWGGLDERFVHHMADHDLCMRSHLAGRTNWMLPFQVKHLGGRTSTKSRYNDHFPGGDGAIHRRAHELFYEKWRGRLPVRVP